MEKPVGPEQTIQLATQILTLLKDAGLFQSDCFTVLNTVSALLPVSGIDETRRQEMDRTFEQFLVDAARAVKRAEFGRGQS